MAAKMQASLRHVLCLFDSTPSTTLLNGVTKQHANLPGTAIATTNYAEDPRAVNIDREQPNDTDARRRHGKAPLRDNIPSMVSDASYVTNPFAPSQTPPAALYPNISNEPRRATPVRPPGLAPINTAANIAATSFLLNDEDKVPATKGYFNHVQHLADSLLSATNALRLSVSLEHAAFLWDCVHDHERSRKLAKRAIREVYASSDGLDDDEFADASALVQALGGIVKRGSAAATPTSSRDEAASPMPSGIQKSTYLTDRSITLSPASQRNAPISEAQIRATIRSPERLSTVPEVDSVDEPPYQPVRSPIVTTTSGSRIPQRRPSSAASTSAASDKTAKRKLVERVEEQHRQNSIKGSSPAHVPNDRPHSRQATPPNGYVGSLPKKVASRNGHG